MEATLIESRMTNPALAIPEAMNALQALAGTVGKNGIRARTRNLVYMRASQINGCSVCIEMHARDLRTAGETDERLFGVAAWRETPYFTDAERAALALTEAVTRICDRPDPVPDEVWDEAARHYDDDELAALVIAIANINVWNRLNVATRQIAGEWTG
jgi:AhpD family alkylhydroperoxidase